MPAARGHNVITGGKRQHVYGYFRGVPKTPTDGVLFWNGVYSVNSLFKLNANGQRISPNYHLNMMP